MEVLLLLIDSAHGRYSKSFAIKTSNKGNHVTQDTKLLRFGKLIQFDVCSVQSVDSFFSFVFLFCRKAKSTEYETRQFLSCQVIFCLMHITCLSHRRTLMHRTAPHHTIVHNFNEKAIHNNHC